MAASPRRVGAETSKTRDTLPDCVEKVMLERGLAYLAKTLQKRADDPVRALWESSRHEATSALMTEFMALGNHRKNIRAEIASATENARTAQLEALAAKYGADARLGGDLSLSALLLSISGLPKFLELEEGVGVIAPSTAPRKSKPAARKRR